MTSVTAMVGASGRNTNGISNAGAVYVFSRIGASWTYQSTLIPSDLSLDAAFGTSIALNANRSLIGATRGNANKGCAYIFDRVSDTWIQSARLIASDGVAYDQLGCAVSLSGESARVERRDASPIGILKIGAAYLFTGTGQNWSRVKFTPTNPNAYGAFGSGVNLSNNRAIIGVPYTSRYGELFQGIAYVFSHSGSGWALDTTLVVSHAVQNDCFGGAVAADDTVVLIGQDLNNQQTIEAGTVYAFAAPPSKGDIDDDGDVDLADASILADVLIGVDSSPIHGSRADMNCDGTPDGRDITYFVNIITESP